MINLNGFSTEARNNRTLDLDTMSPLEIVSIMNQEDENVLTAIHSQLDTIAQVATLGTQALYNQGRIIYVGAGTSGRLGVLDAVECPPTFGVDYSKVIGLMAGGEHAFVKAKEGAEDDEQLGQDDLKALQITNKDLIIGLAASGRTPYVIGALKYAKEQGCTNVSIACNENSLIGKYADFVIEAVVGPEVLTGSTRLKAGTAQKLILNMISTASMIGYGKAYSNLMVDVKQSNEKLVVRAQNIVMEATEASRAQAIHTLEEADGNAKLAIAMILFAVDKKEAEHLLDKAKGHIKRIQK